MPVVNLPPSGPLVFSVDSVVGEDDHVLVTAIQILKTKMPVVTFRNLPINLIDRGEPDIVVLTRLLNARSQ